MIPFEELIPGEYYYQKSIVTNKNEFITKFSRNGFEKFINLNDKTISFSGSTSNSIITLSTIYILVK